MKKYVLKIPNSSIILYSWMVKKNDNLIETAIVFNECVFNNLNLVSICSANPIGFDSIPIGYINKVSVDYFREEDKLPSKQINLSEYVSVSMLNSSRTITYIPGFFECICSYKIILPDITGEVVFCKDKNDDEYYLLGRFNREFGLIHLGSVPGLERIINEFRDKYGLHIQPIFRRMRTNIEYTIGEEPVTLSNLGRWGDSTSTGIVFEE